MKSKTKKLLIVTYFVTLFSLLFGSSTVKGQEYVVCPGIGVKCMTVTTEVPILGEISIPRFKGKKRGAIELKEAK